MSEIIDFNSALKDKIKLANYEKRKNIIKVIDWILSNSDGDFALICEHKDVKDFLNGKGNPKFSIFTNNVERMDIDNESYFFTEFGGNYNRSYIDLNEEV